jgi:hypothetical protein
MHEVFQKPHKVEITYEDIPTPQNYRHWPGGDKLGMTMKVWKVQVKKFPEIDPGLVSDPYGFTDSPDAEVISGGRNSKMAEAVALGRHGNFFLWGFSAQPSDMTPEMRKCFVNAVHYIKKFAGHKPVVRKISSGRQTALVDAGYCPDDLRKRFGKDQEKYLAYFTENMEYLHLSGAHFAVDEDVKRLGLSNRKVELLDRCVAMLEKEDQPELALKVLKRYTVENFSEADQWRAWLDKNRSRLFFTDTGGYRFVVGPGK